MSEVSSLRCYRDGSALVIRLAGDGFDRNVAMLVDDGETIPAERVIAAVSVLARDCGLDLEFDEFVSEAQEAIA